MESYERAGYIFDVTDGGDPAAPAVVLLHGFPQDRTAWAEVAPLLQQAGYRTLAVDMRGVSAGARPSDVGQYRTIEAVNDVVALLDAAGVERAHVVGHDWGGYTAWAFACEHPERLRTVTSVSTPHPGAMKQAMLHSTQALRSWYMLLFQVPFLAEQLLAPGRPMWSAMVRGLPEEQVRQYAARLKDPAARSAALAWYRVQPRELAAPSIAWGRVATPTMFVWGEYDPALGKEAAEWTARYATGPYRFERMRAGHWIPETRPVLLAKVLTEHLAGGRAAPETDPGPSI